MLRRSVAEVSALKAIRCHGMPAVDIRQNRYFDGEIILSDEWKAFLARRVERAANVRRNEQRRQQQKRAR